MAIIINRCRSGRDSLNVLHQEAELAYSLNTKSCIDKNIIYHTSLQKLEMMVCPIAKEKGWYCNCLLNDEHLLYIVCSEKEKGYAKPADIVAQVNRSTLTETMVSNFLTRCPPPEITPRKRSQTCLLYCLYTPGIQIASIVGLSESQVKQIMPSCGICDVKESKRLEICHLYFCKGLNATSIESVWKLPLPTVINVTNSCVQKCILKDSEKVEICHQLKCKNYTSNRVASSLNLPVCSIEEAKLQCDRIGEKCEIVSNQDRNVILILHCLKQVPPSEIQKSLTNIPLNVVEEVTKSQVSLILYEINACGDPSMFP